MWLASRTKMDWMTPAVPTDKVCGVHLAPSQCVTTLSPAAQMFVALEPCNPNMSLPLAADMVPSVQVVPWRCTGTPLSPIAHTLSAEAPHKPNRSFDVPPGGYQSSVTFPFASTLKMLKPLQATKTV